MPNFSLLPRRRMLLGLPIQALFGSTLSVIAIALIVTGARAQQATTPPVQATPLPPVPVEPPPVVQPQQVPPVRPQASPSPLQKAAPKQVATPKVQPKAAPAPVPIVNAPPPALPPSPANALGTYNPALDLRDITLPPGTTVTTAGPVQGYRAISAMSATKTATPIEQIPQSIQVVPRRLIEDQTALSIDEATRNVSAVQATNRLQTPAYDSTTIRGFAAEQWLDGLTVYYNAGNRDSIANVERVEVLKGPAAILYGGGAGSPVGGAINVISKLPTDKAGGEVGLTFGSNKYFRPYFDVNQPLTPNGTVLFRMTGEYTGSESFIDVLQSRNYSLNPTLTFTDKERSTLTIQGRFSRWEQQEYQGLPATGTVAGNFRTDPNLFIGPSNIPKSYSEVAGITVTFDHKFNQYLDASVKARWSQSKFAELAQSIVGADSFQANVPFIPPSTWGLTNVYLYQEQEEFSINPNLRLRFSSESTKNTVVLGADYSRLTDKGILTSDFFLGGSGLVDLTNPSFPTPYVQPIDSPFTTFQKPGNTYEIKGAYSQLQTSIHDHLHLLAGVRLANITVDYIDPPAGANFHTDTTKVLPRVGGVYDLGWGVSIYSSYSEGLRANPFTFFVGKPEPEESKQGEGGFKFNFGDKLTGTAALFEINRSKVPVSAPGGFGALAVGEERSRGFETDWIWQPNRNWQALVSYAHVDAVLLKSEGLAPAGSKRVGVPEDSGRLWVNYKFDPDVLKGWSVGAGIYAASGAPVDNANKFTTQSYFTIDAKIAYENEKFKAAFNVKNLTGESYFVPYSYFGGRVAPGDERAFYGTLAYKF